MPEVKQNQTPREYEIINKFEIRKGKFYDPNEYHNGPKMELRILYPISEDVELFEALCEKIKELLRDGKSE